MSDKKIEIPDFITVRELAERMEASPINVIKELMSNGIMANINQQIDFDTATIVAEEMGFETVAEKAVIQEAEAAKAHEARPEWRKALEREAEENLAPRPPIVTMLGHVDHGKTSLLDVIRQENVQEGEAGGITQHIGAYQAKHDGKTITFLDTPGHEAFTAMRARGAQSTDIAILVVAADDGVMPQTREAADHAKAAQVEIIVALNKIDLPTANPDLAKQQLSEIGLTPDDWDGDTLVIPVSAKDKAGIDDLLEAIVLTAEELNPRANEDAEPTGTVIEAQMEKGRGVVSTVLVQNGTINVGDTLLVGSHFGRIKAMFDYNGNRVKSAGPATPVAVSGLNGIPTAGDQFRVVDNEKHARKIVASQSTTTSQNGRTAPASLDDFFAKLQAGDNKTLYTIVKADVQGSLEPIVNSLEKLKHEEVEIEILRAATGNVSEGDIMLASASGAVILGFNVDSDSAALAAAAREKVEINNYSIIYKLLEDVENAITGMLDPIFQEKIIGRAEVRAVFRIKGVGNIAGCHMRAGNAQRNAKARVIRGKELVHSGDVGSLKHHQEDVTEIRTGFEFGVNVRGYNQYKEGDIIEFFVTEKVR